MMRTAHGNIGTFLPAIMLDVDNAVRMFESFTSMVEQRFDPDEAKEIKASLLFPCNQIASSSGGFLGLVTKISKDEKKALGALAALLWISWLGVVGLPK